MKFVFIAIPVLAILSILIFWRTFKKKYKARMSWLDDLMRKDEFSANIGNALLLLTVGVALSLYSTRIADSSQNFLSYWWNNRENKGLVFDFPVFAFWIFELASFICFVHLIYNQGKNEEQKIIDNQTFLGQINTDLRAAIHNSPNPNVFGVANLAFFNILDVLSDLDKKPIETSKEDFQNVFRFILDKLCLITSTFNNKIGASYCANIMPYIHSHPNELAIKEMAKKGDIFLYQEEDLGKYFIRGYLEGRNELKVYKDRAADDKTINLPILSTFEGKVIYIPGAGKAVEKYENVVDSTDLNSKPYYDHLPKDLWVRFKNYFENEGKEIRSIVSFMIPIPDFVIQRGSPINIIDGNNPKLLGVLNIDCNTENILGSYEKYYETYFALTWPIIIKLAPYLKNYLAIK